jgi:hypothetical protein
MRHRRRSRWPGSLRKATTSPRSRHQARRPRRREHRCRQCRAERRTNRPAQQPHPGYRRASRSGEHGRDRPLTTAGMGHLWSQAGGTSGNQSQMAPLRKRLKQADRQPVATHGRDSEKASKWPFLLPRHDTAGSRPSNLSPRSVPNVRARASSWLEHTDRRRQSTSVVGRAPVLVLSPSCAAARTCGICARACTS